MTKDLREFDNFIKGAGTSVKPKRQTLLQRAEAYAEKLETWFTTMQKGLPPVDVKTKLTRAWLDGYNAGRDTHKRREEAND